MLLAAVLLAGCRGGTDTPEIAPRALADDRGVAVEPLPEDATVVTLAPNLTELVATAAGGTGRFAGVSQADDFPPGVEALPQFGSLPLDREAVVALGPALALGVDGLTPDADLAGLDRLGIPTAVFGFAALGDIPRVLRTLDTLLATSGGAPAAADFERRLADVRASVRGRSPRRVLLLVGADSGTLFAFGARSYASEIVRAAGGENLTDEFGGAAAQPSVEWVLAQQPDVIVVAGEGDAQERLLRDVPALSALPAVQDRRVIALDPDELLRPGPRTIRAVEALARRLHPGAFAAGAA